MLITGGRFFGRVCMFVLTLSLLAGSVAPAAAIRIGWTTPADIPSDFEGYRLRYSTNGGSSYPSGVFIDNPATTHYTFYGLTAGTTYHFRMQSVSSTYPEGGPYSNIAICEAISGGTEVDPDATTVRAYPPEIPADGVSASLIAVTPKTAAGDLVGSGLNVVLETTAGTLLGMVQDNGEGIYTQWLRSSTVVTQARVSATAEGVLITEQAVVSFTEVSGVSGVSGVPDLIITGPGPGPGPDNSPLVRVYYPQQDQPQQVYEFPAYGADSYGVNVSVGDMDGDGIDEIITGAGPGDIYGPHVRGFFVDGTPFPGLNFLAYGTNKYGVNVAAGDLDGDGYDEIITGAGPGPVFGPHVRGWNVDNGTVAAIPGVSYFAYGTPKWGVNVASGDIDGDGYDEIITGAGPGAVYGPHVRGWNFDGKGATTPIPGVSFFAYGTLKFGVNVSCGDVDGDGIDEIITGAGPGAVFGPHVRGWNVDGGFVEEISGINFLAYDTNKYGVNIACGDIDRDGFDEIVTGPGPGVMFGAHVRAFDYDDFTIEDIPDVNFMAYDEDVKFGARLAVARSVID